MNRRGLLAGLLALPFAPKVAAAAIAEAAPKYVWHTGIAVKSVTLTECVARMSRVHADELLYGILNEPNPILFDIQFKPAKVPAGDGPISVSFRRIN